MNRFKPVASFLIEPRHWTAGGLLSVLTLLSACAVGPKYSKPVMQVPTAFKETAPSSDGPNWKAAEPGEQVLRGKWWELFNDSRLNMLEDQINISNQNLKAAEAQFRQARALVRQNRAGYTPAITTSPSLTRTHASVNRSFRPSTLSNTYTDYVLPVDLSYEVDTWGRIRHSVEASVANAQASAADIETVRLSAHAELAVDYSALQALDAEKELLNSTVTDYQKALELTTNRYNAGVASKADVAQAETQLETARAQAIDTEVERAQLEHAIALLIGQPASTFSVPRMPLTVAPPAIPVGLPSQLLERRPDIASSERRVAVANAQIGIARTAYFPVLSLTASAGFEATRLADWFSWPSHFWSIGPELVQTLLDGGRRHALSDQAQAAYDATVAAYRESALTAFQEVEDNLAALRLLAEEARVQEAAVRAAQQSLDIALNQYKGGVANYLQVISAQNAALMNQRSALDVLQRRMTSSVMLIKALGGGWDSSNLPSNQDLLSSNRHARPMDELRTASQ